MGYSLGIEKWFIRAISEIRVRLINLWNLSELFSRIGDLIFEHEFHELLELTFDQQRVLNQELENWRIYSKPRITQDLSKTHECSQ